MAAEADAASTNAELTQQELLRQSPETDVTAKASSPRGEPEQQEPLGQPDAPVKKEKAKKRRSRASTSASESSTFEPPPRIPEDQLLRFEFDETEKLLGLRLSTDVPPSVLAVKPESAGARKGVPLKGCIHAINGRPLLTPEDFKAFGDLMAALKARPLTLLVHDVNAPPPPVPETEAKTASVPENDGKGAEEIGVMAAELEAEASKREEPDLQPAHSPETEGKGAAEIGVKAAELEAEASKQEEPQLQPGASLGSKEPEQLEKPDAPENTEEPETDGDSSANESNGDDRTAADLALLETVGQAAPKRQSPAKSSTSQKDEVESDDSGEDSEDDGTALTAARYDRDIGLVHQAVQKMSKPAPARATQKAEKSSPTSPSAQGGQVEDDEALARRLQEELDLEAWSGQQFDGQPPGPAAEDLGAWEDEMLARQLQAQFDNEVAPARADEQEDRGLLQSSHQPTARPPPKTAPASAQLNPFGNLLGEPVSKLHSELIYVQRQKKLATSGIPCMKVGRNGKSYKRTFRMSEGVLWTDGKGTKQIPVTELTGVYRGNRSEEFDKMARSGGGLFGGGAKKVGPELCCVLTTWDRTFSLYFTNQTLCDEFVETIAYYTQKLTWA